MGYVKKSNTDATTGSIIEEVIDTNLNSIELSTDAKGKIKPTIKCYGTSLDECVEQCKHIYDKLKETFGDAIISGDK